MSPGRNHFFPAVFTVLFLITWTPRSEIFHGPPRPRPLSATRSGISRLDKSSATPRQSFASPLILASRNYTQFQYVRGWKLPLDDNFKEDMEKSDNKFAQDEERNIGMRNILLHLFFVRLSYATKHYEMSLQVYHIQLSIYFLIPCPFYLKFLYIKIIKYPLKQFNNKNST